MKLPSFNKNKFIEIGRRFAIPVITIALSLTLSSVIAKQISKTSSDLKEKQTLKYTLQKRLEVIADMKRDLDIIGDTNYAKLENVLFSTENASDFLSSLDAIAAKSGLKITRTLGSLNPAGLEIRGGPKISVIDFGVQGASSVNTFLSFLKNLESAPFLSLIAGLDIASQSPVGWNSASSINLRGKLYLRETN